MSSRQDTINNALADATSNSFSKKNEILDYSHLQKDYHVNPVLSFHVSEVALMNSPVKELPKIDLSPIKWGTSLQKPVEVYDFCAEYHNKTPAPFYLECLQKAYTEAGGKVTDRNYPRPEKLKEWNTSFKTWEDVNKYIAHLKTLWNKEHTYLPVRLPIPGYETVWFVKDLFLGRRIESENTILLQSVPKDLTIFAFFRIGRQAKELTWRPANKDNTKLLPFSKADLTMTQEPDAPFVSFEVQPVLYRDSIKEIYFGDKRLRDNLQFTLAQTPSNLSYSKNFNFDIRGLFGSVVLKPNCWLGTHQPIGIESWKSISILVRVNELPHIVGDSFYIFQYGPLNIRVRRNINLGRATTCSLWFACGKQFSWKGMEVVSGDELYIVVTQDIDEETKARHLKCFNASVDTLYKNPNKYLDMGLKTLWAPANGKIFEDSNGYRLFLGDEKSGAAKTLAMNIGWVRLFDYELEVEDVRRDVRNEWSK